MISQNIENKSFDWIPKDATKIYFKVLFLLNYVIFVCVGGDYVQVTDYRCPQKPEE